MPPSPAAVERWFRKHQRPLAWRATYEPYHVWVSEVMAQQTRLDVVVAYFDRFIARFPSIESLARATEDDVNAMWSGLGYYRRARMLREGAIDVMTRFRGSLPQRVDELLSIAGIGRYTAGAISSIAFRQRAPIVDGNITRILARLYADEDPWRYAEELVKACKEPRDFNQGLMEIGALICTPRNPRCGECPLRKECVAFITNRIEEFPAKTDKSKTIAMRIPLYLIVDPEGRILMRRETGRLMNALFHLPHGESSLLTGKPLQVSSASRVGAFRHTITTRRIEFEVFDATLGNAVRERGDEYVWVDPNELANVPHPSYVSKALRLVRNRNQEKRVITRI